MSHYTCLVIGDNPEAQLAPYQENNMNDCPKQYLEFEDVEEEHRKSYDADTTDAFVDPSGVAHCKYDNRFIDPDYNFITGNPDEKHLCPIGWTAREVSVKEIYPTFEEYMEKYCGYTKDKVLGRYGRWENPNAKWDWYQLGGRWSGFFITKDGEKTDSDVVENIDFEAMLKEKADYATELYDLVWPFIKDTPPITSWEEIREAEVEKGGDAIERARNIYHEQARVVAVRQMGEELRKRGSLTEVENHATWLSNIDDFNKPRKKFISDYAEASIRTFAVVKDGRWFERGEMGWWACVSGEKDAETWASIHANLLKNLPKGTLLSLYDCHI